MLILTVFYEKKIVQTIFFNRINSLKEEENNLMYFTLNFLKKTLF